jgi:hypothetical protein
MQNACKMSLSVLILLLVVTMNAAAAKHDTSTYSPSAPRKRRYAFSSEPPRKRPRPKAGGLCHTAPALSGKVGAPELPVITTKDPTIIQRWLEEHVPTFRNRDSYSVLGFDVEAIAKPPWMPDRASLPDGPATIQLATSQSCLIVQLARCGDGSALHAPTILRDVVNNPNIIKVGVGVDGDALELYRWSKESAQKQSENNDPDSSMLWEMTSRFDIGCILPSNNPGRQLGLRELASTILGVEITKNKKLAMSNWGVKHLRHEQISYAARDAWVSAACVQRLQRDGKAFSLDELLGMDFMKNQMSLKDINERAALRKSAKVEFKALLEEEKESGIPSDEKRMKELKAALDLYRPDPPPAFSEDCFVLPFH